ncbi:hypothetical protein C8Q80DRAFT_194175 [Daedaleopsis nitida]|nr:hypothetical protein C8Q80DRAFT_194175 [Daedaleopsis nitida]
MRSSPRMRTTAASASARFPPASPTTSASARDRHRALRVPTPAPPAHHPHPRWTSPRISTANHNHTRQPLAPEQRQRRRELTDDDALRTTPDSLRTGSSSTVPSSASTSSRPVAWLWFCVAREPFNLGRPSFAQLGLRLEKGPETASATLFALLLGRATNALTNGLGMSKKGIVVVLRERYANRGQASVERRARVNRGRWMGGAGKEVPTRNRSRIWARKCVFYTIAGRCWATALVPGRRPKPVCSRGQRPSEL